MIPVLERLAAAWQSEAAAKRTRAPHDAIGETLDSCAGELREALAQLGDIGRGLSPKVLAFRLNITQQAVTARIRRGDIAAVRDHRGRWWIPAAECERLGVGPETRMAA